MAADFAANHRIQSQPNTPREVDCAGAAHVAMEAADKSFRIELERVYGTEGAGDARYKLRHEDPVVQKASEAFVTASNAWHQAQQRARDAKSTREAIHEHEA